jgi:hypothetical protein
MYEPGYPYTKLLTDGPDEFEKQLVQSSRRKWAKEMEVDF